MRTPLHCLCSARSQNVNKCHSSLTKTLVNHHCKLKLNMLCHFIHVLLLHKECNGYKKKLTLQSRVCKTTTTRLRLRWILLTQHQYRREANIHTQLGGRGTHDQCTHDMCIMNWTTDRSVLVCVMQVMGQISSCFRGVFESMSVVIIVLNPSCHFFLWY